MTNFLLKVLLLSVLLWPVGSSAQEVQNGISLICDEASQVEKVVSLATHGATPQAALDQVNGGSNACTVMAVAYIKGKKVGQVSAKDGPHDIYEILVVGVMTQHGMERVAPAIQYTPFKSEGREV